MSVSWIMGAERRLESLEMTTKVKSRIVVAASIERMVWPLMMAEFSDLERATSSFTFFREYESRKLPH